MLIQKNRYTKSTKKGVIKHWSIDQKMYPRQRKFNSFNDEMSEGVLKRTNS